MKPKTIAIVSGGMDSVTLAYHLQSVGHDLRLLSIDYGQRHKKELEFAAMCADRLNVRHDILDVTSITKLIATSSLTGDTPVPEGHYAQETMRATVVPNRNMMMLAMATAIAVSDGAQFVATGVHGGDHFIYSDCRPEFIAAANTVSLIGNVENSVDFRGVLAPFVHHDKAWIAREGDRLGVPWAETWSCYNGLHEHCGRCGTCVERAEAFALAGVEDPTEYLDRSYWITATEHA